MLSRLRLAVGAAAEVTGPLPDEGPRQRFAARAHGEHGPSRVVVLHPAPPEGPRAGALLDRMAAIRVAGHPGVVPPLATGEVEGRAWVVEPLPSATLADTVAERGGLTPAAVVELLRGTARALEALHRRGIAHGALSAAVIGWDGSAPLLHGLGRTVSADPQPDWQALGRIAGEALAGASAGSFPELAAVLDRLRHAGFDGPPVNGEAILRSLDRFPGAKAPAAESLVDGRGRGRRDPTERRTILLAALAGVLLLIWFLLGRI